MRPENTGEYLAPVKAGGSSPPAEAFESTLSRQATSAGGPPAAESGGAALAWVGKSLGKYQVTGVLGQGGMGFVLKARDPIIERDVAVKVVHAERLAADPAALARFVAEAKAAGRLNHPNVISIYEICQDGETQYLVLEYVPGGSLGDGEARQPALSVLEATRVLADACKGVGAAHAAGLIHRDLKPANLMRAADGSIKVADFGLARAVEDAGRHLTQSGTVVGTPFFMSPEQCEARVVDRRSDIYSLGATYYSLLTGKNPYEDSDTVVRLMYQHCHGPIPDPRSVSPAIPAACSQIVAKAMAKAPADRYQSAADMLTDLQAVEAALSGRALIALPSASGAVPAATRLTATPRPPASGRARYLAAAGMGFLLLVGVAAFFWRPWERPSGNPLGAPAAGDPVMVGVLHSMSGALATSETPVIDATLFAIDEVNQAGGVLGRPVKAVTADGRSDPATFAREAERLISEEKICTVFGCWTSACRKTVRPVFEAHDHLLIYPVQCEGLETSPCIVYLGAAPNQQILPALGWAKATLLKKRLFLVGTDSVFSKAANAIIRDDLHGAETQVVGETYVPPGSHQVDAAVNAIRAAKADMILNSISGDSNVAFFRALRAAGVTPAAVPTVSFSFTDNGLRSLNTADVAGDYAARTYFQNASTPENAEFVRRFREKYPQRSISDPMETAYIGVKLWAQAVNEAQNIDPKKIRRAMLNQRLNGPGGEVRVDPETQYSYRTPRIGQIQNDGTFQIIWTAPAPVRPDPYPNSRRAEAWRAWLEDLYIGWGEHWSAPEKY